MSWQVFIRITAGVCVGPNRCLPESAGSVIAPAVGFHQKEAAMAIRRSTKSRVAPSHKSVASAPLRHIDVKAPQQMVPDEFYVGWLCKSRSCGRVIAIAATPGGKPAAEFGDQLTAVKCPHCGDENLYHWSARSEHRYTPKSVGI
jgi:hypothetical protein